MQSIPKNKILEFNENTLIDIRKKYDLDKPGNMSEAIDVLEEWIKKQPHFTKKEYDRTYLERIIISAKGSLEKAKLRIERSCTIRTMMPSFFEKYDVNDQYFTSFYNVIKAMPLPKMTDDHCRILLVTFTGEKYESITMMQYILFTSIVCEYLKVHDCNDSYITIVDFRNINIMDLVTRTSLIEIQQCITLYTECFGLRIRSLHLLTPSKAVDVLIKIGRQVYTKKVGNRIHSHPQIESLYEVVPKKLLPEEYGGEVASFNKLHDEWLQVLGTKEHKEHLKDIYSANTDESLRREKSNEEYLGMSGSFRSLNVD